MNKTFIIGLIASIALILGIVGIVKDRTVVISDTEKLAGETHFSGPLDTTEGYKVDDTIVIDADGNVDASITSDTGTFSSTLSVSGDTTLVTTTATSFVQGGSIWSTTTAGLGTSTASVVCNSSLWNVTPSAATTLYLPSTTTLYAACLDTAYSHKDVMVHNEGTSLLTLSKPNNGLGQGIDLRATSSDTVILEGDSWMTMRFLRTTNATTVVLMNKYNPAD